MKLRDCLIAFLALSLSTALLPAQTTSGAVPGGRKDPGLFSGGKKAKDDDTTRSVTGLISDKSGNPVEGAVVKMKDTKTGWLRSYITKADGLYRFNGLSTNIDYELHADHKDAASDTKTLSVFDNRKEPVINLQLEPGKEKDKEQKN